MQKLPELFLVIWGIKIYFKFMIGTCTVIVLSIIKSSNMSQVLESLLVIFATKIEYFLVLLLGSGIEVESKFF